MGQNQCKTLSEKQTKKAKGRAGGVVKQVEHLPSKHEVLSLNPSSAKNKKV
jgi:uncharacterized protein YdgA (DUF945 family)